MRKFIFGWLLLGLVHLPAFATVTIQGAGDGNLMTIVVPSNYAGKSGTFYAYGGFDYIPGYNFNYFSPYQLVSPSGTVLKNAPVPSDTTPQLVSLEYNTTLTAGIYKVQIPPGIVVDRIIEMSIHYAYLVVWDTDSGSSGSTTPVVAPSSGAEVDLEAFITSLSTALEGLRAELNGNLNTRTSELLQMILNLQTQLNNAISRHGSDQSAILNRIASVETDLNDKVAEVKVRVAELQTSINDKGTQIQVLTTQHNADVQRLESAIANLDDQFSTDTAGINAELSTIQARLQTLNSAFLNGDSALQSQISDLSERQTSLQAELRAAKDKHDSDVAALRTEMAAAAAAVRAEHERDLTELNGTLGNLNTRFETEKTSVGNKIGQLETQLAQLESSSAAGDATLRDQLTDTRLQLTTTQDGFTALKQQHEREISELTTRLAQLESSSAEGDETLQEQLATTRTQLSAAQGQLTALQQQYNRDVAMFLETIEVLEGRLTAGDTALQNQMVETRMQLLSAQNELAALKLQHDREVAEVTAKITKAENDLNSKIDSATADLQQDILTVDNRYRDLCSQLDGKIQAVRDALSEATANLNETDLELYREIADLKEKQADYYARLENVKLIHEHDKQALETQIGELDRKYSTEVDAVNVEIAALQNQIRTAQENHARDVAELQSQIDRLVNSLDDEVRAIYQELQEQKQALNDHQAQTLAKFDLIQSELNSLQSLLEKRADELNRLIQYSTYSEDKLHSLQLDLENKTAAKETEIADLELEIQRKRELGQDVSALQSTLDQKLTELQDLRRELAAVKQAIQIRNNDSEFHVIKNQLAEVIADLALVSRNAEQMVENLRNDLLATEDRLLTLIEQVRRESQSGDAAIQAQLDEFKAQVLELIRQLQEKQIAGDDEIKQLVAEMDVQHRKLLENLQGDFQEQMKALKYQQDVQYENLRTTINNISYQQRYSGGGTGGGSYSLPTIQSQEVPADNRDLRVSPNEILQF